MVQTLTFRRTWPLLTLPLAWLFIQAAGWSAEMLARLAGLHAAAVSGNWPDNIAALFAWGLVLVALWLWLRYFEHRALVTLGFIGKGGGRFIAGLLLGAVMTMVAVGAIVALGGYVVSGPGAWFDHLTPTWLFASVLTIAGTVVQAGAKEALFRGWMLQTVLVRWGTGLAILMNVFAFALFHALHFTPAPEALIGIVNLALMAWLLSLLTLRDGLLWGVCGVQAGWTLTTTWGLGLNGNGEHLNVTPLLLTFDQGEEAPWWLTGGAFGPNGSVAMTLVLGAVLLWALSRHKRKARVEHDEFDDDA